MPEYDLNRMQADAVRRAREMQSRARTATRQRQQQAQPSPPQQTAQPAPPEQQEPAPPPATNEAPMPEPAAPPAPEQSAPEQSAGVIGTPQNSLLENLFRDKERAIILALLILLSGEGDNHELMFALMFLLM